MPDRAFVSDIARALYGLEARSVTPLALHAHEGRGIYRVEDERRGAWVLRMKGPDELDALGRAAELLEWLRARRYPAPRVRPARDGRLVGSADGWAVLALSYVDGAMLAPEPAQLGRLAQVVARLHALPSDALPVDRAARCHPDTIATAARRLALYGERIPPAHSRLVAELRASMEALQQHDMAALRLTHGDCWYMNAVQGARGRVTLIDWDNVGLGAPLLDLGCLLLTAHFDASRPLLLEPDAPAIAAIVRGYGRVCPIAPAQRELLVEAMRFLLAVQLGQYLADPARVRHPEFPFVLQKLQARHDATRPIAEIAAGALAV